MKPKTNTLEIETPRPPDGWAAHAGQYVKIKDLDTGNVHSGCIRLKAVMCGKKNCTKCPHHIYAYAQFRKGKKVTEKYLGVAR